MTDEEKTMLDEIKKDFGETFAKALMSKDIQIVDKDLKVAFNILLDMMAMQAFNLMLAKKELNERITKTTTKPYLYEPPQRIEDIQREFEEVKKKGEG